MINYLPDHVTADHVTSMAEVVYRLRDRNWKITKAWQDSFQSYNDQVQVSQGDIFKDAPAADAIISPANSFGFMGGGINKAYTEYFGEQLQNRLKKIIRTEHHGELLVGEAIIMTTYEGGATEDSRDWRGFNENQPIKYLISAPTMRVPLDVRETVNSYLAFRAAILAVKKHNSVAENELIRSILCPGLGTAVGNIPPAGCAYQMLKAFETFHLGKPSNLTEPQKLGDAKTEHMRMIKTWNYNGLKRSVSYPQPSADDFVSGTHNRFSSSRRRASGQPRNFFPETPRKSSSRWAPKSWD